MKLVRCTQAGLNTTIKYVKNSYFSLDFTQDFEAIAGFTVKSKKENNKKKSSSKID